MDEQKRKNRRWLAGVLSLLLLGVLLLLIFSPAGDQGPRLRGRQAIEWLEALVETNALSADALAVFQEAGARVVPFLELQATKRSWWSDRLRDTGQHLGYSSGSYRWIEGWTSERRSFDVERRNVAVRALGSLGPAGASARETLKSILDERPGAEFYDARRLSNAFVALVQVAPNDRDSIKEVVKRLPGVDPNWGAAAAAYVSLKNLGPEGVALIPYVIDGLRSRKAPLYLFRTTRGIVINPTPTWEWDDLFGYLVDTDHLTRESAAYRLQSKVWSSPALLHDPKVGQAISKGLLDSDPNVRLLMAETLVLSPGTVPDSVLLIVQKLCTDSDYGVRLRAVELLRQLGVRQSGSQVLLERISTNDPAPVVQVWAAKALTELKASP